MKVKAMVLASMLALGAPSIALAGAVPEGPHITTSGNATIKATPDMATLNIQVSEKQKMQLKLKNKWMSVLQNILPF
ncbi:oxidative stress defense protein [Proteus mirabilis]|uniref:Oxidative stress defense protein n=1 Tax=Proteus mirabilis TaxID=584 RepID=A0A379GEZ0_PROMI|nr:oxidative stress defense protein [Proteus mirabilis]